MAFPQPPALALVFVIAFGSIARAEVAAPRIHPGAIETALSGSLVSVEGSARASVTAHGGSFIAAGSGLAGAEIGISYGHVTSLDLVDLELAASWQHAIGATAVVPFLALAGGVREETIGSFRQARYPVGFDLGVRVLASAGAGVRLEYRLRRVLSDPVRNFTEHQLEAGVFLLFRNRARP